MKNKRDYFNPPIETRKTEELIEIANSEPEFWQREAIDIARLELIKRGITREYQDKVLARWKLEIENFEKDYKEQLIRNEFEGYTNIEMLKVFIFAPFYLFGRWIADYTLFDLWRENYKKKFVQRIIILITGTLFWIFSIILIFNISEKNRLKEIEKIDISDWEKNYYGNDTIE